MFKIKIYLLSLCVFYGCFADEFSFTYPSKTPTGVESVLSEDKEEDFISPRIATSDDGCYVYAFWQFYDGTDYFAQIAKSNDYGATWTSPTSTPQSTPNISEKSTASYMQPQVETSSDGKYVYVAWNVCNSSGYFVQVARSEDYGETWVYPESTPTSNSPNLSVSGSNEYMYPRLAISADGKYVYVTWHIKNSSDYFVQIARSEDYGKNWSSPETVPTGVTSPNISTKSYWYMAPYISTSIDGMYVYVTWAFANSSYKYCVQIIKSEDYGKSWIYPDVTPRGTSPSISQTASSYYWIPPRIANSGDGKYVYCVWYMDVNSKYVVQMARSDDYGTSWYDPSETPSGTSPNISEGCGGDLLYPQIKTSNDGKYVYSVWYDASGAESGNYIKCARSEDYGNTWKYPTSTPTGVVPNLSVESIDSMYAEDDNYIIPQLTNSKDGKYVFASWKICDGSNYFVQVALSTEYGDKWVNPLTTPTGVVPNLSLGDSSYKLRASLKTNSDGKNVYVVWQGNFKDGNFVQVSNGNLILVEGGVSEMSKTTLLLQKDFVSKISWNKLDFAKNYKVYDVFSNRLLYEGDKTYFYYHNLNRPTTLNLTWIGEDGVESSPTEMKVE